LADDQTLIAAAARLIEDRKGERIVLMDLRETTIPTGYFLVAEGHGNVQVRAIARAILEGMPVSPRREEGLREGAWVLLDYGDFTVHVFDSALRAFYDLEGLWPDCIVEGWRPPP